MSSLGHDSLKTAESLDIAGEKYYYFSIKKAEKSIGDMSKLPFSLKVILENLLRFEDDNSVKTNDIKAVAAWLNHKGKEEAEIAYRPARVLMQDFTGVPAVVDLAAMRDAMTALKGNPEAINPLSPVDLVIDHSVMVDEFGNAKAFSKNVELEYERNSERYEFLKWGQQAFQNFRVVPPGTGICHQVNLEYLSQTVWTRNVDGKIYAYPDTLVGTDSHTTMVNGMAVLGWGVGGIEAEAAMLGQPVTMLIPEVIGFKLIGKLKEGVTATDLVLTVTEMLRKKGVVGKFVEFYGAGLNTMSLEDRATIANMAPEYGATCGFFPIDSETIRYLKATGRDEKRIELVEVYAKAQGMWRDEHTQDPIFTDTLELNLETVEPSIAGPKRPQDRILLKDAAQKFKTDMTTTFASDDKKSILVNYNNESFVLKQGSVVIAAITSCTNTSNPSVMIAAGLVAKKAAEKGLKVKPWVKTSLAPGSQVVTDYLNKSGLQIYLDKMGFDLVGYGCTTCIGNSGPLPEEIANAIQTNDLVVSAVLSGNRNFEGRVNPHVKANYLASPPLVVAYAIAGNMNIDITAESLGKDLDGHDVYLKDIWPNNKEIAETLRSSLNINMFTGRYNNVFKGDQHWQKVESPKGQTYSWKNESTYVQNPPYFVGMQAKETGIQSFKEARILAIFGDSITTDHISPAGNIKKDSPAGRYLLQNGVAVQDFNSYGARRGNHEVMMRGTFANIRIKNEMMQGKEGGYTVHYPSGNEMAIYDAAMQYALEQKPLVIFAGKEYGTGSSRDWAAKGTNLLGVKAVIAESFERIHRSNLVGMGILPLTFKDGQNRKSFNLIGNEMINIEGIDNNLKPRQTLKVTITNDKGENTIFEVICRIDTNDELNYFKNGGILPYVLRSLTGKQQEKAA